MQRNATLARYLNPWKFKREQQRLQRIAELRQRDGDHCRRCRRPVRFDLPAGHDQAPSIHDVDARAASDIQPLQALVHIRCSAAGADNTAEVKQRVQRKGEAALFARSRRRA